MTTTTAEKPADLAAVRRLPDPKERLRLSAEVIAQCERDIEPRRLRRNSAAIILFRRANAEAMKAGLSTPDWPMQPVAMWRDAMAVSRSLWHKIVDEADPARLVELNEDLVAQQAELAELPTDRAAELPKLVREVEKLQRRIARHEAQVAAIEQLQTEIDADPEIGTQLLAIARDEALAVRKLELLMGEAMKLRDEVAYGLLNGSYGQALPNSVVGQLAQLSSARTAQLRNLRF